MHCGSIRLAVASFSSFHELEAGNATLNNKDHKTLVIHFTKYIGLRYFMSMKLQRDASFL